MTSLLLYEDIDVPETARKKNGLGRIFELDGIRGLAILSVLCCHLGYLLVFGWREHLSAKIAERIFGIGWLGVDVFFVLSGFLITGVLLKGRSRTHFWKDFYIKRGLRILPVFCLVFGITLLFITPPSKKILLAYVFFAANWTVLRHAEIMPLNHVWSLAVEEQFYFVWPGFVRRFSTETLFRLLVLVVLFTSLFRIILVLRGVDGYIPYKITPTHVDGLAIGAIIALMPVLDRQRAFLHRNFKAILFISVGIWGGAFVIFKGNFLAWNARATVFSIPATIVITGLAIIASVDGTLVPRVQALLSNPLIGWFGRRSYAIYLIHEPLDQMAQYLIGRMAFRSWKNEALIDAIYTVIVVGVSLALAEISWRLIERRCLALAARLTTGHEVLLERVSS
jgi:peptidoglycan/LPS O-acetylase OafA/YrhL